MRSIHRNTSPPPLSWLGWLPALMARLERLFGRAAPAKRAGPSAPAVPAARASPVPRGLRVLVADDDPANLEGACALLERCGVLARVAVDGVQAVALARVHDFDLILMDLQMPVLDGLAATMQIRAREKARARPRVPVLAYSSFAYSDELLRACGLDGVLAKPCSENALRECLRRWCGPDAGTLREGPAALGVRTLR